MAVTHGGGSGKKKEAQNSSQALLEANCWLNRMDVTHGGSPVTIEGLKSVARHCVWKHLQEANSSVAAWLNSMDVTLGGGPITIEAQALATEGFADM